MADTVNQEVMGVVENMSWFTADDGKRYELFGQGGGQALADELEVPLFAQIPLLPAMREGADRRFAGGDCRAGERSRRRLRAACGGTRGSQTSGPQPPPAGDQSFVGRVCRWRCSPTR